MPQGTPIVKVERSRQMGANVRMHGTNFDEALSFATEYARSNRLISVPPFDHPNIIAGQGTAGLEILAQIDPVDAVILPVGGGGLISRCCDRDKSAPSRDRCNRGTVELGGGSCYRDRRSKTGIPAPARGWNRGETTGRDNLEAHRSVC